jgi:hypothetical protein
MADSIFTANNDKDSIKSKARQRRNQTMMSKDNNLIANLVTPRSRGRSFSVI